MKKVFLALLFCVVLSFGQKGYANLDFGISPEQVKQKVYAIKYIAEADGLKHYQDNNVSYPITSRLFSFFDNKLMVVTVTYDVSKAGTAEAIIEGLLEKYNVGGKLKQADSNTYYAAVSDDLQIEIEDDPYEQSSHIRFRGLKIHKLYVESQKKKLQNNLGF